jgi:alpha-1,3/alpha-1,6-mannosyltransferase
MLVGTPVLAADEGGPRETVVDGQTGWLRNVKEVDQWAEVIRNVLDGTVSESSLREMGGQGRARVKTLFSKSQMAARLDEEVKALNGATRPPVGGIWVLAGFSLIGAVGLAWLSRVL